MRRAILILFKIVANYFEEHKEVLRDTFVTLSLFKIHNFQDQNNHLICLYKLSDEIYCWFDHIHLNNQSNPLDNAVLSCVE